MTTKTTTGKVLFINPPTAGQRSGSVKLDNKDSIWMDAHLLAGFTKGENYTITYNEKASRDPSRPPLKIYVSHTQVVAQPVSAAPVSTGYDTDLPRQGGSKPDQSEHIFVTGVVGRAMGSGKFSSMDILELTRAAKSAYDVVYGNATEEELDDRIPF